MSHARFIEALLAPDAPVPPDLIDPEGRPPGKRFDVYRNNVAVSLTEALITAFPVLVKLIGEERFRSLAGAYLRRHPPRTALLMFYGEDMPAFLEGIAGLEKWGYLPDVARLELAVRRSYHAADASPLDPARLGALAPDDLVTTRVKVAPATHVVRSRWPLYGIWRFNMEDGAPKPDPGAEDVLVARDGFDPVVRQLPAGAAAFLGALSAGGTIGSAFEAALADAPGFDLTETLGVLLSANALTDLEATA